MRNRFAMLFLVFVLLVPVIAQDGPTLTVIGTYETGLFDEGAAEIGAYDAATQRFFVINAEADTLDVLDLSDPTAPTLITTISFEEYGDGVNSVAVFNGLVAAAVQNEAVDGNGQVVFLNAEGDILGAVEVGVLPDMVTFTPDGTKVLTANEGEPAVDYSVDPEGSVSIIDIAGGVENATVVTAAFTDITEVPDGVRIYGPNATIAQDLEPEYVAVSPDSSTAFVTLQENNALAVIDIASASVTGIVALGFKDHSVEGNALDAGKDDGVINIANWPIFGVYQPDAIAAYEANGEVYIVTANEGDAREYDTYTEAGEIGEAALDPETFPNAEELAQESAIGGMEITIVDADTDGDGDLDVIYVHGGRSFTIWNLAGQVVFDSGDQFETILAEIYPENFNASNDDNALDDRSDNKGPEPEGLALGVIGDQTYAFIGLERIGGVMVYNITDPTAPAYVTYANNRDFSVTPGEEGAGDLGPEGLVFVSADESPTGTNLLVVTNEISGSTTVYELSGF
ncbi:MAG: choice-of-anchor I family protein [Anaerolineae bacterium]